MTAVTAVAFDAELTVIHVVDESTGCPRGIPSWVKPYDSWLDEWGTVLVVVRCAGPVGHTGPCTPPAAQPRGKRPPRRVTRCGLVVGPTWIDYPPDAATPCPRCHGTDVEDPALF